MDIPAATRPRSAHVPALDGLRGIAILLVLGIHAAAHYFPGGGRGVDVFFVLSGFLITGLLITEQDRAGRISLRDFYARRALRLGPALVVVVAVTAVATRLLSRVGTVGSLVNVRDILGPLLYVQNWVEIAYHDDAGTTMSHAWSLAVEEQFYLLWPFVVILLARRVTHSARWLLAAALLASVVMAVRLLTGTSTIVLYHSTESHGAVMLLTGAAIAYWWHGTRPAGSRIVAVARAGWPVAAVALAVMVFAIPADPPGYYLGGWVVAAAAVATILVAALAESPYLTWVLSLRPLRWFGTISYGLYLWHFPLHVIAWHILVPAGHGSAAVALAAFPLALLIAVMSYYGMERPIVRAGRDWLERRGTSTSRRGTTKVSSHPKVSPQ